MSIGTFDWLYLTLRPITDRTGHMIGFGLYDDAGDRYGAGEPVFKDHGAADQFLRDNDLRASIR
jgi:hypothetical protein